jgi:uncharacterized membrane-anchored protein YjiN (DUF445 family)
MNADIVARLEDSFAGVTNANEFSEKLQEMASELVALSTENREMRRLYIEAVNSNFDKIPKGLKSKYGILLNELLENEKNHRLIGGLFVAILSIKNHKPPITSNSSQY